MRFHVIGLPHTVTSKAFLPCAYTQKVLNFCKMMTLRGHTVFHYGAEGATAESLRLGDGPAEHISVIKTTEQRDWFGEPNMNEFFPDIWPAESPWWFVMQARAVKAIREREQPGDLLCCIAGFGTQSKIADAMPHMRCVEFGVGYRGVFSRYRVWESNAHRHFVHGWQHALAEKRGDTQAARAWDDGHHYDTVIQNYFDVADFDEPNPQDYYLFIGRMNERKGVQTAVAACRRLGAKLLIVGQGGRSEGGYLVSNELRIKLDDKIQYLGVVTDPKVRARLLSGALGLFVPTLYLEPFGGVFAEGLLSGTPVITSDWGAFPEYVRDEVDGFRCNLLGEFTAAAEEVAKWGHERRMLIKLQNERRFGLEAVAAKYETYFKRLQTLDLKGPRSGWNA